MTGLAILLQNRQHILIEGDASTGKDWALDVLLNALEYPMYKESVNENTTSEDIMGWWELVHNSQKWFKSKLQMAVENNGIYYLSEINRCKPGTTATLYNFLESGFVLLANQEILDARDKSNFMVIATANPFRRPYSAHPMPSPLRSRFKKFRFEFLPEAQETAMLEGNFPAVHQTIVERLVKGANKLRKQYRFGLGDIPYQVGVRLLEQVLESLMIDPLLFEGDGAIDAFIDAYGAISQGFQLSAIVTEKIRHALKESAIKLDKIEEFRPISAYPAFDDTLRSWLAVNPGKKDAVIEFFQKCPMP